MSVEQNLEQILSARYGKDVRQSIHDAIYDINEVAKDAEYHASTAPTSAQAYANAALAAEQAAQQAKQDAEAAAEQAMSGTPTGYEQVVAEVRSLKTNEGTVLAQAGTFVGRVLFDKMYGMSIQNGTPTPSVPIAINSAKANFDNHGKNIVPFPYHDGNLKTSHGITFTVLEDGAINVNGTADDAVEFQIVHQNSNKNLGLKAGDRVTLSDNSTSNTDNAYVTIKMVDSDNGNLLITNLYGNYSIIRTVPVDYDHIKIAIHIVKDAVVSNLIFRPMITYADVTDQTFEKYQGQSITTDLTLRAIEVKSSADYNLVKDGKYYIADTLEKIDGGYQIRRRIKVITLDGTESWSKAVSDKHYYISLLQRGIPASLYINDTSCFSEYFVRNNNLLLGWGNAYISDSNINLCNYDDSMSSVANLKTWLSENTPNMWYALETPTIEFISNTNAKLLLSLKSYDEATYVAQTEDTEGVMVLKYGSTELSNMAVTGCVEGEQNSIRLSDLESAV